MTGCALITGGRGLLGRRLLEHWCSDTEPVMCDRRENDLLVPGTGSALIRRLKPALVVHLAWTASGTPDYRTSADNQRWLDASLELAAAARKHGAWFVGTGTGIDDRPGTDAYSLAKAHLRRELAPYIHRNCMSWLRPFYVVDPIVGRPALVDQALAAKRTGSQLVLRTPSSLHDFVHVDDAGRGMSAAVAARVPGVTDVGTGQARSVARLVEVLGVRWRTLSGNESCVPMTSHGHRTADARRLLGLGWSPYKTEEMFSRE